jgi:hypothetical protein
VTIYYCLTCALPPESVQRLYEDTLTPPSQLGSDILPHQEKALLKAMAVLASDRYGNIADFEKDIYAKKPRVEEKPQEKPRVERIRTEERTRTRLTKENTPNYKTLKRIEEEKPTQSSKQEIIDDIFNDKNK